MPAPALAHLYALALRALDAHERRRHELRARLAPILAATAAGIALLAGPAASAAAAGSSPAAAALVATVGAAVVTLAAVGRVLDERDERALSLDDICATVDDPELLADEDRFHRAMIDLIDVHDRGATRAHRRLSQDFTVVMCGMLVVLCGLALTALVG